MSQPSRPKPFRKRILAASTTESETDASSDQQDASCESEAPEDDSFNLLGDQSSAASEDEEPQATSSRGNRAYIPNKERNQEAQLIDTWGDVVDFEPRFAPTRKRTCEITPDLIASSSPIDIFFKLFPTDLLEKIANFTNKRLEMHASTIKKAVPPTNIHEIQVLLGCVLVMCYNKMPHMSLYWSNKASLGNDLVKKSIARDRFKLLISKIYVTDPCKPPGASKLYYIEDLIACLKQTFQETRSDSSAQSIDESMTKFKGRSSMKQYLPMKPVKRGMKIWMRCDSLTGYTYDFDVYTGKEATNTKDGTLGERVVQKLASTIKNADTTLAFDRFFTSVSLIDTLPFPAVGTCMRNRKNLPTLNKSRERGEVFFTGNSRGTLLAQWIDTKEVIVLSNCHKAAMTEVNRKQKDGTRLQVPCPESVCFYRAAMGGVDTADQMAGMYEFDRKSDKWWMKVFHRCLMYTCVNAWVVYKDLKNNPKKPFLNFVVELAEKLICEGRGKNPAKRNLKKGRKSKIASVMTDVGLHLPIEGGERKRCQGCAAKKKERRTKTICRQCNEAFCKDCFAACHS